MALQGTRVESFPFDSQADGYDVDGYPVYDRAVGAWMLRSTFAKFFSDGVFPNPSTGLQMTKGNGLNVLISPGMFIIKGAIGGIPDGSDPISVKLSDTSPQGNTAYGIMLRYDENSDARTLSIRAVAGSASADPQPPAPDRTTPGVWEYRLGYVTVPNGDATLANATITSEKGESVCPFAAPFEEIDVDAIVQDFKVQATTLLGEFEGELDGYEANAQTAMQQLLQYFNSYKSAVDAALDDSEATYLQGQINEILEQLGSTDLSDQVDGETIGYSTLPGDVSPVLHVRDGAITADKLAMKVDWPGGLASTDSLMAVSGDLAQVAYTLGRSQLDQMDLDSIIDYQFPGDVKTSAGQYDSGGNKYYAAPGTGA